MAAYDALATFINGLSPYNKNRLARKLAAGNTKDFCVDFPEFKDFLKRNKHGCNPIWLGNNKCYHFQNFAYPGEDFVLKLERWSMPRQVADLCKNNADLQQFLAPIYLNVDCHDSYTNTKIQIQPYCKGGSIENVTAAVMTPEERIKNCISLYKDVTSFYRLLENLIPPVLFPDGKPSNFTLDSNNKLQITDTKTFEIATPTALATCRHINNPTYPLFVDGPPPPRELKKVHSRHVGINMYIFLTQAKLSNVEKQPLQSMDFSAAIFQTEKGQFLKKIIQATFSKDQSKRPDVEEINNALSIIELLTQLDIKSQADPSYTALTNSCANIRAQFTRSLDNNLPLNDLLSDIKYILDNQAQIKKVNALLPLLFAQNEKQYNQYLDKFIKETVAGISARPPELTLQDIISKLEYRVANEERIRQTFTRLEQIQSILQKHPDNALEEWFNKTTQEFHARIKDALPFDELLTRINEEIILQEIHAKISDLITQMEAQQDQSSYFKEYLDSTKMEFAKAKGNKLMLQSLESAVQYHFENYRTINQIQECISELLEITDAPLGLSDVANQFEKNIEDKIPLQDFLEHLEKRLETKKTKEHRVDWTRFHKKAPSTEPASRAQKDSLQDLRQ